MPDDIPDSVMLQILLQEKAQKNAELFDYNKRLDRTIVLYITAAYAAVGLNVSGQLNLEKALQNDNYVWLVFTFILLNACILFHALAQSCWCMSLAKFVHIKIDSDLLTYSHRLAGRHDIPPGDMLNRVDSLGWDDWTTDSKGVGLDARQSVTIFWFVLVIFSSIVSLAFVNLPRFLQHNPYIGYPVLVFIIAIYFRLLFVAGRYFVYVRSYHVPDVTISTNQKKAIWSGAIFLTAAFTGFAYFVAVYHPYLFRNTATSIASSPTTSSASQLADANQKGDATKAASAAGGPAPRGEARLRAPSVQKGRSMQSEEAMLQEFAARKEHILNLEMRQFWLVLALEVVFAVAFVFGLERLRANKAMSFGSAAIYFVFFFELVAVNAKMGLVSMYLRQLEAYMADCGFIGAIWESKALEYIIFRTGNAFTLAAGLTIACLLAQTLFVVDCQIRQFAVSITVRVAAHAVVAIALLLLTAKAVTVDFRRELPQIFRDQETVSFSSAQADDAHRASTS